MKHKVFGFVVIFVMMFLVMSPVSAVDDNRTLQDLIDELNVKKNKLAAVNADKTMTEAKINQIKANINQINSDIITIEGNIDRLNKEIVKLGEDIVDKDAEVKRIMNQYQLSNGDSAYVEYVMGSATVTDFIFRLSIVEQLTEHNENLITQMNNMIVESEEKAKQLAVEKVNITNKKASLYDEQFKLGDKKDELNEHALSLTEEINDAIKTIENYKKYFNCKPHQKLKDCASFPLDSSFARPLDKGTITSDFGGRVSPVTGVNLSWHSGVDIGGNPTGTNVYSVAAGRVVLIGYNRCGGNYVIVQHNINGKYYASRYLHLNSVSVKTNQQLTKASVIGGVGGGNYSLDICTTGPHLDLTIAAGVYGQDFVSFTRSGPIVNPKNLIKLPALGGSFYGRF